MQKHMNSINCEVFLSCCFEEVTGWHRTGVGGANMCTGFSGCISAAGRHTPTPSWEAAGDESDTATRGVVPALERESASREPATKFRLGSWEKKGRKGGDGAREECCGRSGCSSSIRTTGMEREHHGTSSAHSAHTGWHFVKPAIRAMMGYHCLCVCVCV